MTKSKFDSLYRSKVHGSNNNFFYLDCKLPRPNNYERSCKHCITTQNGQLYPTNTSNAYLTTINKQIQNDVCPICFEKDDLVANEKCGHRFHTECLVKWLQHKSSCPVCRVRLVD